MKRILALACLFFVAATPALLAQWARTYGGAENDSAASVVEDWDGNFLVVGSTASYGQGKKDFWVLKLNPEGRVLWQKAFGDPYKDGKYDEEAASIILTRDRRYLLLGPTVMDALNDWRFNMPFDSTFLKLTSSGRISWQRILADSYASGDLGSSEPLRAIVQASDGSILAAGSLTKWHRHDPTDPYERQNERAYVVKMDKTGVFKFFTDYTSSWKGVSSANSIVQSSDGNFLVAGLTNSSVGEKNDLWLFKINSWGNFIWQYSYGGAEVEQAPALQGTPDGGCLLAGTTNSFGAGGYDAWLLKLDAGGNIQWQKCIGGEKDDYAHAVQKTRDGGYIVAGTTASFGAGNQDCWVFKLDAKGKIVWQKTFGGKNYDGGWAVLELKKGGYLVAGRSASYGRGGDDALILKLDKNGKIAASCGSFAGDSNATVLKTPCSRNPTPGTEQGYTSIEHGDGTLVSLSSKGKPTVICEKSK